jgi:ubiquinone/menaquinone biosynthesis C-methylase UbiE
MWNRAAALAVILLLASCRAQPNEPRFPEARRDVAPIVGDAFSTEDARDRLGEAEEVMELAGTRAGMSVADVGAGEGYYTIRLARVVGPKGRVLAEDIVPDVRDALSDRIQRERLDNVSVKLGTPDNPMLPAQSFDRVFLVHMYHEVRSPYAFLWHLRDSVKPDGLVVVVDSNRPIKRHGIPPAVLKCEFASLGMDAVQFRMLTGGEDYFMAFRLARPKPAPEQIAPCGENAG